MKRTIGFALGNLWRWSKAPNRAKLIDYLRELDIDGVEITLGKKNELYGFNPTASQVEWLKSLGYVSIHAPFRLARKAKNEAEVVGQLDRVQEIYSLVNAKTVIIHPGDLPRRKVLDKYDMHFSTENLPKKRHITIANLEKILKDYQKIGLCIDVAHAYFWSEKETGKLVDKFYDRISEIHLSGTYKREDHLSLRKVTGRFIESIQPIKKLNVPIIIEEDIVMRDDLLSKNLEIVKDEVRYIRSLME